MQFTTDTLQIIDYSWLVCACAIFLDL